MAIWHSPVFEIMILVKRFISKEFWGFCKTIDFQVFLWFWFFSHTGKPYYLNYYRILHFRRSFFLRWCKETNNTSKCWQINDNTGVTVLLIINFGIKIVFKMKSIFLYINIIKSIWKRLLLYFLLLLLLLLFSVHAIRRNALLTPRVIPEQLPSRLAEMSEFRNVHLIHPTL